MILAFDEEKKRGPTFFSCSVYVYSAEEGAVALEHAHKAHIRAARTDPGSMRHTCPQLQTLGSNPTRVKRYNETVKHHLIIWRYSSNVS